MEIELEFGEIQRKQVEVPELSCHEKCIRDKYSRQFLELSVALFIGSALFFFGSGYDSEDFTYFKLLSAVLMTGSLFSLLALFLYHKGVWYKEEKIKFYKKINEERNPVEEKSQADYEVDSDATPPPEHVNQDKDK